MNQDELESTLEQAGLSPYEADAFTSLLWLQEASVKELLDTCSVPQPRIYDVLRELAAKGYVETYEEEVFRARVHDPSAITTDLNAKANSFRSAVDRIEDVWEKPVLGPHKISVFSDVKRVTAHAGERFVDADHSIQVATDVPTYLDLLDQLREARRNDVFVKLSLYDDESFRFGVDDVEEYFEATTTTVKRRRSPAPFMALVDGTDSYFGLDQSPVDNYGLTVDDQAMSSVLYWFFQNALWEIWETIYDDGTSRENREYAEIRHCIRDVTSLLDEGETVEATVYGYDIERDRQREISGEIVETVAPDDSQKPSSHGEVSSGRTTIFVETSDETYSVGGFGAILEDIKATRIVVTNP